VVEEETQEEHEERYREDDALILQHTVTLLVIPVRQSADKHPAGIQAPQNFLDPRVKPEDDSS